MLRSILILFVFTVIGLISGVVTWINWNWHVGLNVFAGSFVLGIVTASVSMMFVKELSTLDIFLPIPLSIVWSIIVYPIKMITTDLLAPPEMWGSAFLLTASLWMYKQKEMSRTWIIFPILTFLYEMLPISLPTDIDNLVMLGGSSTIITLQFLAWKKKSILAILPKQTDSLNSLVETRAIELSNCHNIVCDEREIEHHKSSMDLPSEETNPLQSQKGSSLREDLKILAPQVGSALFRNRFEIIRLIKNGYSRIAAKLSASQEQGSNTKQ